LPRLIEGLAEIAGRYDLILCDVWGVIHNGAAASAPALDALARYRAGGGAVVLITNSPAPSRLVKAQLEEFGASKATYDAIVSSGDVTVALLVERAGQTLFHIGAAAETGLFDEAAAILGAPPRQGGIESAHFVLCTGFIDFWRETPPDYDERLKRIHERGLDFICANPDLVVEVDGVMSYCAGAIAERYQRIGGTVIQAGKPFSPIYDRALALARAARCGPIERAHILAIGDAMRTDIRGAAAQGFDSLLITSGIHRDELHRDADAGGLDAAVLSQFVEAVGLTPTAALPQLVW
jgi:HAD superfamily hydrolase (TIGR01459 family)